MFAHLQITFFSECAVYQRALQEVAKEQGGQAPPGNGRPSLQ